MTQEEFDRITKNCQPHSVWKKDWESYNSLKFADTFLPKADGYIAKALNVYDGAELFKDIQKSERKTLSLTNDDKLLSLISYTYTKGVLAENRKDRVQVAEHEICTFIEINKNNSIDIHFKFGDNFKAFLHDYFNDIDKFVSISSLEDKTYKTTIQNFQKFFDRKLVHYNMMQYVLKTLGVEISEVNLKKRLIQKVVWLNIKNKNINKDKKSKLSNIFFGKKVKLKIIGKRLKARHKLTITIGFKIKDKIIYPKDLNKYQFEITPKENKAETPYFKIPFEWYDEAKEYYDYSDYKTKIKEEDLLQITAKIEVKKKEIFLEEDEILVPITYHRNYEELIGLFKKNTRKAEKDRNDNYENYLVSLNKKIEKLVAYFQNFIYQTDELKLNQIENRVKEDAEQLWLLTVEQSQKGNLDDRPLYWARNKMQATLKRHPLFKNDIDLERSIVTKDSELDKIIILFEELSRNYTGIDFSKGKPDPDKVAQAEKQLQDAKNLPNTTPEEITARENAINEAETNLEKAQEVFKILITGFDPFVLNQPKYYWADIKTQNPSGISALFFHNKQINNAIIQTAIFPVRYEDFDNNVLDKIVEKNINDFDIMMTMSRNDKNFDLERFASKFRGGYFDNMNIGNSAKFEKFLPGVSKNTWDISRFKQITEGNEFYETTLPIDKILKNDLDPKSRIVYFDQSFIDTNGNSAKHPNKGGKPNSATKDFPFSMITGKSTYDSGSGGDYLSNEMMYRATRKRNELGYDTTKQVGHVHIANGMDFEKVLMIISKIISNAIN